MFDENFSKAQAAVLNRYDLAAEERWIEAPVVGGQAHVLVTGEGPPVVMLNGIGIPAAMWAPLMARLDGVTQYAVDPIRVRVDRHHPDLRQRPAHQRRAVPHRSAATASASIGQSSSPLAAGVAVGQLAGDRPSRPGPPPSLTSGARPSCSTPPPRCRRASFRPDRSAG